MMDTPATPCEKCREEVPEFLFNHLRSKFQEQRATCPNCNLKMLTKTGRPGSSFGDPTLNDDLSVTYERKGYEPPPEIDGYQRDSGNAWRFVPLWKPCPHRMQIHRVKECGGLAILTYCEHEGLNTRIDSNICANCPFKDRIQK